MKFLAVIIKCIREQLRSHWILILTVSMAPFFVFVYYLINEAWQPTYRLVYVNDDQGIELAGEMINHGDSMIAVAEAFENDTLAIPLSVKVTADREQAMERLQAKKADALVLIPADFSVDMDAVLRGRSTDPARLELVGDLTDMSYMLTAIWAGEALNQYLAAISPEFMPVAITETSLGVSGEVSEFDMWIPGLLILSLIMLMFTATIAIVTEVENGTIIRLKLSRIGVLNYLGGITVVQLLVGILSILLTLGAALLMGFNYSGSLLALLVVAALTSVSIIAFSLILAAITKSANEVLIVGNFPLFLFMFFTGAAFPLEGKPLFTIGGYAITVQGIMSPTHAVVAVKKILIMGAGLGDVLPELTALTIITVLYWLIGAGVFYRRHMRVE